MDADPRVSKKSVRKHRVLLRVLDIAVAVFSWLQIMPACRQARIIRIYGYLLCIRIFDILSLIEYINQPRCMKLTCIECKNEVDLTSHKNLTVGHVVECQMCGITLEVTKIEGEAVEAEIVEEGK